MPVTVLRDARFMDHDPGEDHPEHPARIQAADRGVQAAVTDGLQIIEWPVSAVDREDLLRIHTPDYVETIDGTRGHATWLDPDTATSEASVETAYLAAGATVDLAIKVAQGETPPGIALVRPPGHHATPSRAMGFCLFNNLAVAARAILARGLAERIAIYDWDVHHGNGTQDAFFEDQNVLYLSTHQWPFYPGTGAKGEVGRHRGEGHTMNVPLPAGTGDETLLAVTTELLSRRVRDFGPDVILISAGFDPFVNDPLGGFDITAHGFSELSARWRDLAETTCNGRIAAVLEGGYDREGLEGGVRALLKAWDT